MSENSRPDLRPLPEGLYFLGYSDNPSVDGEGYMVHFTFRGDYYLASSVSWKPVSGYRVHETMIFPSNYYGKVVDWLEVYCRKNIDIVGTILAFCDKEFNTYANPARNEGRA